MIVQAAFKAKYKSYVRQVFECMLKARVISGTDNVVIADSCPALVQFK